MSRGKMYYKRPADVINGLVHLLWQNGVLLLVKDNFLSLNLQLNLCKLCSAVASLGVLALTPFKAPGLMRHLAPPRRNTFLCRTMFLKETKKM